MPPTDILYIYIIYIYIVQVKTNQLVGKLQKCHICECPLKGAVVPFSYFHILRTISYYLYCHCHECIRIKWDESSMSDATTGLDNIQMNLYNRYNQTSRHWYGEWHSIFDYNGRHMRSSFWVKWMYWKINQLKDTGIYSVYLCKSVPAHG